MYEGRARHPVMVALEETVARYEIPIEPFEALIDAFVQDQSVTEYLTYHQLADYCTRSANPVGHLVLYVAGAYSDENARLSDATCTALQLANFWQDVARDLAIGRIYLPREDRERFGYPESDLRALRFTPAFAELMKFEVERTRRLFEQGLGLPGRIPGALAVDVDLFSRGGLAILDRIEACEYDVLTARPALGKWTKIGLLGRALLGLAVARSRGRRSGLTASHAASARGIEVASVAAVRTGGSPVSMDARLAASYRFCGEIARREARNFYFAFRLLPPQGRMSMCALYAFMRHTDDLADEHGSAAEKEQALACWKDDLDAAIAGQAGRWPGLLALADTVARCGIPSSLLHEVIEGVSMDVRPRRYASFDELADYCYHVASTVGLCCIHIWGFRSEDGKAERLASACGIALQLTNIIRDVREDVRGGRIYLPEDDLARFGVDPRELDAERPSERLRDLLAFEARRAYDLYDRARDLVPLVDPVGRPVLLTIVGIYRALARRDRPARLQRADGPREGPRLAEGRHRPAGAAPAVPGPQQLPDSGSRVMNRESAVAVMNPVRKPPPPHVVIIGGGLAGLAAASCLVDRGLRITLLESRPRLGGRACSFTDPVTVNR